ncbi:Pre-mRNA-splicing factor srp2 [Cladobotryum mycophilum]|uniref:Pre-mRNA-splicing factor srp2 n=1 Tax=Cladobotryum mycophilum TaxID=491253 RepID=A0ABR0S7K4_9HYPO
MTEVSSTRLYLGNLPRHATKADVEAHFATHGTGEITEVKLMNGFGFIEYKDAMDARDVVPAFRMFPPQLEQSFDPPLANTPTKNKTVPISWGNVSPSNSPVEVDTEKVARDMNVLLHDLAEPLTACRLPGFRTIPAGRSVNSPFLVPGHHGICDLKDFARQSSLDVVYSETGRDSNGRGFVEFESAADLRTAVEKLDGREFKGNRVQCVVDTQPDVPARDRGRSRSPGRRPYPRLSRTTPAVVPHEHTALVGRVPHTDTAIEALGGSTTMTEPATVPLLAGPWKTTHHLVGGMKSLIDVTTRHRPIPTPTEADLHMIDRQGIFPRGSRHTHGRDTRVTMIVVDATSKSILLIPSMALSALSRRFVVCAVLA